jgi:uncharacterized protein YdaU (DUF1376 family)
MTTRPWFPFYTADYDRDTKDLTIEQHGVYMLLLKSMWDRPDCSFPNDMAFIRRVLPQMHGHTFNRLVPPILERFFYLNEEGHFVNKRLTKERQTSDKLSVKQSQNAKKRWKNNDPPMPSHMPSQSHSHKEEDIPPSGGTTVVDFIPSEDRYAFQQGVIRLKEEDLAKWKLAFTHVSVEAELIALASWAGQQTNWFIAVSSALAKREREAVVAIEQAKTPKKIHWRSGIEGVL